MQKPRQFDLNKQHGARDADEAESADPEMKRSTDDSLLDDDE